ncbi:Hypothetical protein CINCED_3A003506 [Cinara cedri]|uniref:Uncharacterized protein n=1 Tax=Cinara cedri TaxID=506608 RepID=A0A5E4M9X2_9HEMI|nr:Hypothetical protein CINCED_3A003506 [Cinara cedri]
MYADNIALIEENLEEVKNMRYRNWRVVLKEKRLRIIRSIRLLDLKELTNQNKWYSQGRKF